MRLAAALAVGVIAAVAPQAAHARTPCSVPGTRVVLRTHDVAVVRHGIHYTACYRPTGRKTGLGDFLAEYAPKALHVRGHFLAYERDDGCFDPCWRVAVLNTASGTERAAYPTYGMESLAPLKRLAVDAHGRAAWIRDPPTGRELHRMDSDGEETIDTGGEIEPSSLVLSGNSVRWRHGSQLRTVTFDSHPACAKTGSSALQRTPEERIYWLKERVYACHLATGRTTFIGGHVLEDFEYYGGGYITTAGHFVTIDEGSSGREGATADLSVWDASLGQRVHRWRAGANSVDAAVSAVVLAADGAVAWIDWRTDENGVYGEVRKSDADGDAVVLDRSADGQPGAGIDLSSLTISGRTVSWLDGGQQRTAVLR